MIVISRVASALMAAAFLPCLTIPLVVPEDEECYLEARKVDADYYISCNANADCPVDPGLCSYSTAQVGLTFYHSCKCDSSGTHSKCDGYLVSRDPDPSEAGTDVLCFEEPTPCSGSQVCDEEQLTSTYKRLCVCK